MVEKYDYIVPAIWRYDNRGNSHREIVVSSTKTVPCRACNKELPLVWQRDQPDDRRDVYCEDCATKPVMITVEYAFLTMCPIRLQLSLKTHVTLETFVSYETILGDFRAFDILVNRVRVDASQHLLRDGDVLRFLLKENKRIKNHDCHTSGKNAWLSLPRELKVYAELMSIKDNRCQYCIPSLIMMEDVRILKDLVKRDEIEDDDFDGLVIFSEAILALPRFDLPFFRCCDLVRIVDHFYFLPLKHKITNRGPPSAVLKALFDELLKLATKSESIQQFARGMRDEMQEKYRSWQKQNLTKNIEKTQNSIEEIRQELKRSAGEIVLADHEYKKLKI